MKKKTKNYFAVSGLMFLVFVLFTILVACYNVEPVGPDESSVGFADINRYVFQLLGVHLLWYHITDWLGVGAILFAFGFAMLGLCQLIRRKSLRNMDARLFVLGAFYILVIACYLFFEQVVINYRPVILGEGLEASYPSSHTVIVVCIMATAAMQFRALCPNRRNWCLSMNITASLLITVTVAGRLISGVHWFTDIVGGLLLSAALIALFCAVVKWLEEQ